ncbi:hypothetical protein DV738_g2636, partial [Chaetothyriales sp. CBS 135597]
MYYLRFLSPPKVAEGPRSLLTVNAVLAVTTDLGDDFCPDDLTVQARVVDGLDHEKVLQSQSYACPGYSRALKISLSVPGKYVSRDACVHVAVNQGDSSSDEDGHFPHVLDVWSTQFHLTDKQRAEPLVERRLAMSNGSVLRVLEETGDSIARHIWDASLGFLQHFDRVLATTEPTSELQQLLSCKPKRPLRVIELGAGCGIVGIAFAQLVKSDVLLTDLDDALDILTSNIRLASPAPGSRLEAMMLDWSEQLASTSTQSQYDLILVSDCIYNPDSSIHLVETLQRLSKQTPVPLILVGYKHRHSADQLFFDRMREAKFSALTTSTVRLTPSDGDGDGDEAGPAIEFYEYRVQP